jgi:OPA family sugar phosphate sensor protein UhpC-like MFS transporter
VADEARPGRGGVTAFAVTWLAYATYYLGRKGFSVSKAPIAADLGLSKGTLATIDSGYLAAYAVGQFVNGALGDRLGARRLVAFGMWGSAVACALFGSSPAVAILVVAYALNGYFQSTGWAGTTKGMAEWTAPRSRGLIMGLWCTCYQLGGVLSILACTWLLGHLGWRSAFRVPAIAIATVGLVVFLALERGPYQSAGPTRRPSREAQRALLRNPVLWSYGLSYFFIKLIRYCFLFWLPYYLHTAVGFDVMTAGYLATSFEVGGTVGAVAIGLVSDRLPRWSRSAVAAVSLVGLAGALLAYAWLVPRGAGAQFALVALIGCLLVGPDSLLSGAAAQEAGGPEAAALAAGFVNGVGSIGALVQGWVTVGVQSAWGWSGLFYLFVALALLSAVSLVPGRRVTTPRPSANPGG